MKNLFLIIALIFCTSTLVAQDVEPGVERKGFVIGIGVGVGTISMANSNDEVPFDEGQGGLSLPNLKLGWMVHDRLAILAAFPGMVYEHEGIDRSFEAFVPSVQYWLNDQWWINGGFGLAMDVPAFYEFDALDDADWNFGCALALSAGYEFVQRKNFTIDFQTKLHLGRVYWDNDEYRDAAVFTVGVGFNWY